MPFADVGDVRLYYEFTGPEDAPLILQFGGSLFGRANFDSVNDGFREKFRLLSFDASGYGRSTQPLTAYSIEGWADEGAGLLDALGIERVLTHGTSMGGMIALAFTAKYPDKTIASCADCAFARCDVYRRTMFRNWRQQCEALPLDDFCALLTIQAVGAGFIEEQPRRVRQRRSDRRAQLALHGAPGVHRDGDDGPGAARAADPAPDPVHQRLARHHDPARPRALWLLRRADRRAPCRTGRACTRSPTSAMPTCWRSRTRRFGSSPRSLRRSSPERVSRSRRAFHAKSELNLEACRVTHRMRAPDGKPLAVRLDLSCYARPGAGVGYRAWRL